MPSVSQAFIEGAIRHPCSSESLHTGRPLGLLSPGCLTMIAKEAATQDFQGGTSDGADLAEARILVKGQSTGGYFRAHARNEAQFNRSLRGALRERGDGETEIIVEGKTSAIRSFVRWCNKGPGLAQRIEEVTVDWSEYTGIFEGFEVIPNESVGRTPRGVA
ncbi:unnamed protein product [Ascophyllum nodosum]